jgi:DUF1680 family protein
LLGDDLSLDAYPSVISALKTLSKTTKVFITGGNSASSLILARSFSKKVSNSTCFALACWMKNVLKWSRKLESF